MPNNNFIHEAGTMPTALQAAVNDYVAEFSLRTARIAAGRAPSAHPIDRALAAGFTLMEQTRPAKVAAARARMQAPLALQRTSPLYARLADANLDAPDGIDRALAARNALHRSALSGLRASYVHIASPLPLAGAPPNIVTPQAEYTRLRLFLNEVRCIDETGSGAGEWGSDETYLIFTAVDENGESQNNKHFKVRNFDDNTTKVYTPPMTLGDFNIREGGNTFPKVYTGVINLMEHDNGSIAEWAKDILYAVRDEVTKYLRDLVGVAVGAALGPIGAAIGNAIADAINKIIGIIVAWWEDDDIGTRGLQATINSYTGKLQNNLTSMTGNFDLTGTSSRYRVFYTWQLS